MKLTALDFKAHQPGSYRVSIDHQPLGYLSAVDVLDLKLTLDCEISPKLYSKLLEKIKLHSFYAQALKYADRRLHSRAEVENYLRLRGCPLDLAKSISAKISALGVIDEAKLAHAFIHDATAFKPMSNKAITAKLKQKRLDPDLITQALNTSGHDDNAALDHLIAAKSKMSAYLNNQPRFFRYLLNQGFAYDEIKKRIGSPKSGRSDRSGHWTAFH